jgi:hypothetical protein
MNSRSPRAFVPRAFKLLPVAALGFLLGAGVIGLRSHSAAPPPAAVSAPKLVDSANAGAALHAEIDQLKGKSPDQSHAMADVGYHFANLWFAADRRNWPLARFYFDETRSHLKWAVRIIPVRKDPAGNDVDLTGILQGVDNGILNEVQKAIETKDSAKFVTAYKRALEGCYSCHKASGKPYLRPQIPEAPPQPILNFDPDARWPE